MAPENPRPAHEERIAELESQVEWLMRTAHNDAGLIALTQMRANLEGAQRQRYADRFADPLLVKEMQGDAMDGPMWHRDRRLCRCHACAPVVRDGS